ncbi:FtsX-like permease family protein [Micromonospora sp. NPDC050187]|uniref:FtsX-like permease family protein n=1 Tax=Micromonospora sp. NPDC050187 TaxID=3364277 RepID=UPI0037BBCDAF
MSRRNTVLRTQLGDAARRPARLLLMGLAMVIAAFVAFGTVLAEEIAERTVLGRLSGTPAAADVVVGPGDEEGATTRALAAARQVPGVAEAVGRTDVYVEIDGQPGTGLSLLADPGTGPLATVRVLTGGYPDAPGEIAVSERTVDRLDLSVGATVRVSTGVSEQPVTLTVSGVLEVPEDTGELAYTSDGELSRLAGHDGLMQVEVRFAPDADPDAVRAALDRALAGTGDEGSTPVVSSGEEARLAEAEAVSERVHDLFAVIAMFVATAVVAATLVATSTFRIVFAQRMRQLALLRAVGADRSHLFRALVAEGALTGLVAGLTGVLAATGLGYAVPLVLRGLGREVALPGRPVGAAVAVVLGTVLVAVLAVTAPAVTAARVAPLEALRTASTTAAQRGVNRLRAVVGILGVVGAALVFLTVLRRLPGPTPGPHDPMRLLLLIVASGTLAYTALVALGPVLVRPVLATIGWPLRRLGPVGRLAVGGVGGAPRRAAAVSVVVALGVTLIAGALVGSASLTALSKRELAGMAPGDLHVAANPDGGGGFLPDGFVERVRAEQDLTTVVPYRGVSGVTVSGGQVESMTAVDLDLRRLSTWADFGAGSGSLDDLGPGRVVLLSYYAEVVGVRPGETLTLTLGDRTVELRLAATLDNTPVDAGVLLDPADLDRLGVPAQPTGLLADLVTDGEDARTAALKTLRTLGGGGVAVQVLADAREDADGDLREIFGVMLALLGLTVIVSVVGVGTTTALSVVERIRESGLLRAVGMSRNRLRAMLTVEAGLYGLLGAVIGLVLALPYSWLTMAALGGNVPVEFPAGRLALVVVALAAATALAGLLPARRAARVSPVMALGAGD